MSDQTITSSLLRQEGPQQEELHDQLIAADALIASMKRALQGWLDANAPGGWIDDLRQAAHTRLTDLAAAQARIEVLEGSIDYLRNVIDHPVTQEPVQAHAIVKALLNEQDIEDATHGNYDAETFKRRLGDLWQQRVACVLEGRCPIPPFGWRCTRTVGHDGPCAAVQEEQ